MAFQQFTAFKEQFKAIILDDGSEIVMYFDILKQKIYSSLYFYIGNTNLLPWFVNYIMSH